MFRERKPIEGRRTLLCAPPHSNSFPRMSDMLQFGNNLTQGQVGYGSKIKLPIRVRPQNTIRFKVFTLYLGRLANPHGASFPAPGHPHSYFRHLFSDTHATCGSTDLKKHGYCGNVLNN